MSTRREGVRAFTLVELLVVIGIIAVLVGVLLPALTKARDRGNTIACQSNLRQVTQAVFIYAAENKGSLPYGFIFNRQQATGRPFSGTSDYITWYNVVDQYMTRGQTAISKLDGTHHGPNYIDGSTKRKFSPALRCPSAPAGFNQKVHYYNHGVAMPHMPLELRHALIPEGSPPMSGQPAVTAPARLTDLYPENALFWDTPLWYEAEADVPSLFWVDEGITGFALGCTSIDRYFTSQAGGSGARGLINPAIPELRYRSPGADRFANSTTIMRRPEGPIAWLADEYLAPNNPDYPTANVDPAAGGMYFCAFGGPRWRHNGNTTANTAFADGSVQGLRLTKRIISYDGAKFQDNEFKRKYIMIKWPSNKRDSNTVLTG